MVEDKLHQYIKNNEVVYQELEGLIEVSNSVEKENRDNLLKAFDTNPVVQIYKKDDEFIAEDFQELNNWSKKGDVLFLLTPIRILICISQKEAESNGLTE